MSLEQEFKCWIETYGFSRSLYYFNDWKDQVKYIDTYWDNLIDDIDHQEFKFGFNKSAQELELFTDDFDLLRGFKLSKTAWRIELMTIVADRIVKWWSLLDIPENTKCVHWTGLEMMIKSTVN